MSQVIDYASLVSYITAKFDRAGDTIFTGNIDNFIGLAEDTWTPTLLNRQTETTAALTTDATGLVALPADFYRMRSVSGVINGANTYLPQIGPSAVPGIYPVASTDTPQFCKIVGNNLYLIPGLAQAITLDYWAKFVGLSSGNTTNFIIANYSGLYQMSVCAQAAFFNDDIQGAALFDQKADAILNNITDYLALDYYMTAEVVVDTVTP